MNWIKSREGRKWLYSVTVVVIPLLVLYGVIDQQAAPLWAQAIGVLFGVAAPAMALRNLTPPVNPEDDDAHAE